MTHTTCEIFGSRVDELAIGTVGEPERSELMAHASACPRCGEELRELAELADAMLELAPEIEPPLGFEERVVAAIRPQRPGRRRRWTLVVAAAAVIVAVLLAANLVAGGGRDGRQTAVMTTSSGARLGTVELSDERVIVTVERGGTWPGQWFCELQDESGSWRRVGAWRAEDAVGGVWAAGVGSADAVAMRITNERGSVVASAEFD